MSTENENQIPQDVLGMSDDDILNMNPALLSPEPVSEDGGQAPVDNSEEGQDPEAGAAPEGGDPAGEDGGEGEDEEGTDDETGDEGQDPGTKDEGDDSGDGTAGTDDAGDEENTSGDDTKDNDTEKAVTPEEFYKRITAPFKANGKDIQVDNPDDAIRLMQMGANYNKKMAALKPNMKMMKLLENNELLDEQKLGFLIDLQKGDKGAIAKLIKDSGVDPLDLGGGEQETEYKPNTYTVDEREMALDSVIEDIRDTETYSKTIDLVSNKWDDQSKQTVAQTPQLLSVINDHMASGVYDRISQKVESERMLGRLNGMTDIEAYHKVGDALQAQGAFKDLFQQEQPAPGGRKPAAPAPKQPTDPKLKEKRRAASSPKKAAAPSKTPDFNPLELSDDDFEKQTLAKFL